MYKKIHICLVITIIASLLLSACVAPSTEESQPATETSEIQITEEEEPTDQPPTETAEPKELKQVNIAVGTYVLNASYYWLMMPKAEALGYYEDMGYKVNVEGVGGSLDALQQVVGGNADFAQGEAGAFIQANVQEDIPIKVVMETKTIDYGLAVPDESDIKSIEDIKGEDIGVFNLASGGVLLLKAYLKKNGIDPDKDVNLIPVGYGPQASEALNRGDVSGVMLWGAALNQLENLGHDFRYFRDEAWSKMPEFSLSTTANTIQNDRQMVVDIVKATIMATVFTKANPECAIKIHWANWPDTKPADVDDETAMEWDLNILMGTLNGSISAYELHGSELWGIATEDEFARLQEFLLEWGQIEEKEDPTNFFINDPTFWEEVNDFDHEAIREQALECDFDF